MCSEGRIHFQYNVKLNRSLEQRENRSLEQRENRLRREKCYRSPSNSALGIVSANKIVCMLLKQALSCFTAIKFQKGFPFSYILTTRCRACRVVEVKLRTALATSKGASGGSDNPLSVSSLKTGWTRKGERSSSHFLSYILIKSGTCISNLS